MSVQDQKITKRFAVYNGDCIDVMSGLPDASVHLSVYSPPFSDLYNYSSSERDLSNCQSYEKFFEHYEFVVKEVYRLTLPGRLSGVHCMDIPRKGDKGFVDFPGDIIRLHERVGFYFHGRYLVWKEPLRVRNRTMSKGLAHKQIVKDSSLCDVAGADHLLMFRRHGRNKIPIVHPLGLVDYVGERVVPPELQKYRDHPNPRTNRLSHWIWRQYASAFWDDVRVDRVLAYKPAKDKDDEKHVCPLQLDVIERCLVLWSNPGETVLTPFMGVGSEVYAAVQRGRRAVGIELKKSYYRQALRNLYSLKRGRRDDKDLGL